MLGSPVHTCTQTDTDTHACIEKIFLDDEPDQRNSFVSSYRIIAIQLLDFTNVITFISLVSKVQGNLLLNDDWIIS